MQTRYRPRPTLVVYGPSPLQAWNFTVRRDCHPRCQPTPTASCSLPVNICLQSYRDSMANRHTRNSNHMARACLSHPSFRPATPNHRCRILQQRLMGSQFIRCRVDQRGYIKGRGKTGRSFKGWDGMQTRRRNTLRWMGASSDDNDGTDDGWIGGEFTARESRRNEEDGGYFYEEDTYSNSILS